MLFLPTPLDWPADQASFQETVFWDLLMAASHICGALLFLTNLNVYKAKLRRAYIILAAGTFITGIGTLQITLLTTFGAWQNNAYAQSGATMLPFILSGVLLYAGVRAFARTLGTTHFLTKAWLVFPAGLLLAFFASFLPHTQDPPTPEITYDIIIGISVWSGSLIVLAGFLAYNVSRYMGALYTSAAKWLTRALFVSGSVLLFQAFYVSIYADYNPVLDTASNAFILLSGLVWIRAGYAFALTKYYAEDLPLWRFLFATSEALTDTRPKTTIDMVIYAASLVSNSQDIDPLLDKVRSITARLNPGEKPSATETESLMQAYLKIEQYLVVKEAARNYTRNELRARLDSQLQKGLIAYENKANGSANTWCMLHDNHKWYDEYYERTANNQLYAEVQQCLKAFLCGSN